MSIRLFVKFKVADHQADALIRILQDAKSGLLSAPGCEAVEILQSADDSIVVLSEQWASKEIHEKFVATIEANSLDKLAPLLKSQPEAEIFEIK